MPSLTPDQLKQYEEEGYIAPIDVLSKEEAKEVREEIELIEKKWPNELEGLGRNYIHLISPVFDKVCNNTKILDAVESLIGKNILVCGTTLFVKNPNEKGFVSFHQDAKYIGLEPHNWVTAWVAITDANEENGCMRMWSGSHKNDLQYHNQKFDEKFVNELKLNMPDMVYVYSQNSASSFLNFIKIYQTENLWMNTNLMCIGEKTSSILNEIKWKKIFLFNPGEEEFLLYKI